MSGVHYWTPAHVHYDKQIIASIRPSSSVFLHAIKIFLFSLFYQILGTFTRNHSKKYVAWKICVGHVVRRANNDHANEHAIIICPIKLNCLITHLYIQCNDIKYLAEKFSRNLSSLILLLRTPAHPLIERIWVIFNLFLKKYFCSSRQTLSIDCLR